MGAVLTDPRCWADVAVLLQPDGFYLGQHRLIWGAIARVQAHGQPVDTITVLDELRRADEAEAAGGLAYLADLAQAVISARNVVQHAGIVAANARARRTIAVARDLIDRAHVVAELDLAQDEAVTALLQMQQGQAEKAPRPLEGELVGWLDELQQRADGHMTAMPTGLHDCDRQLGGGLERGDLVVIASRPSMGKTALCHTLTRNMAGAVPVLVLSMEDSIRMLISRNVAAAGRVNLADIRNPARAQDSMWARVEEGVETLRPLRVYVDDQSTLSLRDIRRKAQQVRAACGDLGVVVVDYLQLMEEDGQENRAYELNKICRGLKRLAKDLQCAVVLLSQLSRKADENPGKPPRMDHLAESGGIEQAADIIGLLWRKGRFSERPEDKHHAQIEWVKNKNGATGTNQLFFDGATQRMETATNADDY